MLLNYPIMVDENANEMDLGLALGVTNQPQLTRGAGAGAGANANSRISPLSELVWSTQNGLTIRCATCSKQPHCCCCISKTQTPSPRSIAPAPFLGSSLSHTDENVGDQVNCLRLTDMVNCNKGKEKERFSSSCETIPDANVAGTSEGSKSRIVSAHLLPENIGDGTDRFSLDFGLRLKMQDMTQTAYQEPPLPDLTITAGCAPFLEKFEETDENDVIGKEVIGEREDSHDESMNSGNNILSNGNNKRWRFEEHLIIESKRIKKQSQECHPPPPVVKQQQQQQDSSFMNWISNMVKGVRPSGIDDHKTLNLVSKGLGFQTVFKSLYSQDGKGLEETKTPVESSKSKEIILFNKTISYHVPDDNDDNDDNLNQKASGNLWITRFSPKTPSNLLTSNNKSTDNVSASIGLKQVNTTCEIDAFKDIRPTCLPINENRNLLLKKMVSNLNGYPTQIASTSEKNKLSNEDKILKIPKQMFDTIKRLRLSRTDILKWMNSRLPIENLDGYFLRLRLAKWDEEVGGGAGYYVARITDENPSKGSKKSICVNIGGVQCLVESRYISNCDFLQDELVVWWRTTLKGGVSTLIENDLTSKLDERNKLGF